MGCKWGQSGYKWLLDGLPEGPGAGAEGPGPGAGPGTLWQAVQKPFVTIYNPNIAHLQPL